MITHKLDYNLEKIECIQLSNDAYHFLAHGEPCLDESNMDEVEELKERFLYGFKFGPDIEPVEDSDLIECSIIPICECDTPFTHYRILENLFKEEYYYSKDKTQVYYRLYLIRQGRFLDYGWNKIEINQFGKPAIKPRKNCFPLWGKSWMKY